MKKIKLNTKESNMLLGYLQDYWFLKNKQYAEQYASLAAEYTKEKTFDNLTDRDNSYLIQIQLVKINDQLKQLDNFIKVLKIKESKKFKTWRFFKKQS